MCIAASCARAWMPHRAVGHNRTTTTDAALNLSSAPADEYASSAQYARSLSMLQFGPRARPMRALVTAVVVLFTALAVAPSGAEAVVYSSSPFSKRVLYVDPSSNAARDAAVFDPDRRCVVIGAGGAGRAICHALAAAGLKRLGILNETPEPIDALAAKLRSKFPDLEICREERFDDAGLLVNATPLGLHATDAMPMDVAKLPSDCAVFDIIAARRTEFMQACVDRGLTVNFNMRSAMGASLRGRPFRGIVLLCLHGDP